METGNDYGIQHCSLNWIFDRRGCVVQASSLLQILHQYGRATLSFILPVMNKPWHDIVQHAAGREVISWFDVVYTISKDTQSSDHSRIDLDRLIIHKYRFT